MPPRFRPSQRRLLDAEPTLAAALRDPAEAREAVIVQIGLLQAGEWSPPRAEPEPGHLGFMIVGGVMTRELHLAGARSLELLNQGDLLRPWDEDAASFVEAHWIVREPVALAALDRNATVALSRWPELMAAVVERGLRRSRSLAVHAAIENMRGLEDRLLALFWHLAERWGERRPEGVVIPLDLTHQMLSDLVGARRPSVTTALGSLRRREFLTHGAEGWLLQGDPPSAHEPPLRDRIPETELTQDDPAAE